MRFLGAKYAKKCVFRPDTAGGAYNALLAGFKRPTSRGHGRSKGEGRERKGREKGEGKGERRGRGAHRYFVFPHFEPWT